MDEDYILAKLKESSLGLALFIPDERIMSALHKVIFVNDKPVLSIGFADQRQAEIDVEKLMKSLSFKAIVKAAIKEDGPMDIRAEDVDIEPYLVKKEFDCIIKKEPGEDPKMVDESNEMVWFSLLDDRSFCVMLCISGEIQKIAKIEEHDIEVLTVSTVEEFDLMKRNYEGQEVPEEYLGTFEELQIINPSPFNQDNYCQAGFIMVDGVFYLDKLIYKNKRIV